MSLPTVSVKTGPCCSFAVAFTLQMLKKKRKKQTNKSYPDQEKYVGETPSIDLINKEKDSLC